MEDIDGDIDGENDGGMDEEDNEMNMYEMDSEDDVIQRPEVFKIKLLWMLIILVYFCVFVF